jgi:DNA processing protein|tara:strand:+ start:290 stop:1378 length:1089 start_codon:yes stop_codon:yes gene_type:complete
MKYTILFSLIKGMSTGFKKKLIDESLSAESAFLKLKNNLKKIKTSSSEKILKQIQANSLIDEAEKIVNICEKSNIKIVSYKDNSYPKNLFHCVDAPLVLYCKGAKESNEFNLISIVGTRNCSDYGLSQCEELINFLKPYNIAIVSGLAYGIDVFAHRKANLLGITNYAVLGSGINNIYPKSHLKESEIISNNGMLISEFLPDTGPRSYNFPKRNRIIAGMSKCSIVIESPKKGGAMITARLANDYNRDVFAIPGNNNQIKSKGTNWLIENHQATILNDPEQIITFLNLIKKENNHELKVDTTRLLKDEKIVYNIIRSKTKISLNEIQLKSNINTPNLTVILTNLEMNRYVKLVFGNFYMLKK